MYSKMVRMIKLLSPLCEELSDCEEMFLMEDVVKGLESLRIALESASQLLKSVHQDSKIFQAMQFEQISMRFRHIAEQIEGALSHMLYEKLGISDEVREQIELAHLQFRRWKEKVDSPDLQLKTDLLMAETERYPDPAILKRLTEKLHLSTMIELKRESLAIHDMVNTACGVVPEEMMSRLLKQLKEHVTTENPEIDKSFTKRRTPVVPDNLCCPTSLELMKDHGIISTGQKLPDTGHKTYPETQQTTLKPSEGFNGLMDVLSKFSETSIGVGGSSKCDRTPLDAVLQKLANGNLEEQRAVTRELRLMAKRNADNRVSIAQAGAIPVLVGLLSSPDSRTQEHSVTTLLYLSINEANKRTIVNAGSIPHIVEVLKNGVTEARENAAATLFSLSVIDEYKVAIGAAGVLPALIDLLCHGTPRGKKDAASALFNLSIYQGNKASAVRAGIVLPLIGLLKDHGSGMVDEALAILVLLASNPEGGVAIGQSDPMPVLVEIIRTGSPRNRENAAALLCSLCTLDVQLLKVARELGVEEVMKELSQNGTDRAKIKAGSIMELLHRMALAELNGSAL